MADEKNSTSLLPPHASPHARETGNVETDELTRPRVISELNRRLIEKYISYLETCKARNTVRSYSHALRSFVEFLDGRGVGILAVQHSDLLEYLTTFEARGRGKQTQIVHVEAFRGFAKFARLLGLPCTHAFRRLRLPKKPRRIAEFHPVSDVELLIEATRTPFELALIELAFATGCRIAELAGMRVEQIDWESQKIVVLGKGNKERLVFFGLPAKKALRAYLGERTKGFLFGPSCMAWRRERVQVIRKIEFTKLEWCWSWIEGSRHPRYVWLGEVKTTSQAQAEAALRTFVKEDFSLPLWLSEAVPNKTTREVWWRSYWLEYDPVRGRVHRYCWLGSNATTGRDEALKRLRQLRAGRSLTPPLRVEQRERVHFRDEIEWVVRRVRSHSRIGEPYTVRHLSRFFEDIGRRAGIKTHCHALRHSAATAMFTHGAPIRELQELLGHSSVSTTASTYLHSSTNDLMEVHRKFHPREENGNGKEA